MHSALDAHPVMLLCTESLALIGWASGQTTLPLSFVAEIVALPNEVLFTPFIALGTDGAKSEGALKIECTNIRPSLWAR